MCLGVPGQIVSMEEGIALVDIWGARINVRLDILEEVVEPGDYIVEHAGYAIRRISPELVADTLALYEAVLGEAGHDPIARDVIAELV
jgi:hydrogenase expression/formation protein HypC